MVKIIEKLISKENTFTRPGNKRNPKSITIHETDNTNVRANALAHARLQLNGNRRQASWHYTVDDEAEVYRSIPDDEMAFHAGDSGGNKESIAIEICVNRDGDFRQAVANAQELVRYLLKKHPGISSANVVQHHHWSGKNCPRNLRAGNKGIGWPAFIKNIQKDNSNNNHNVEDSGYVQTSGQFAVGEKVLLKSSAIKYATGEVIPEQYKGKTYTVQQRGSNRTLLKELYSWVKTIDLNKTREEKGKGSTNQGNYKGNSIVEYLQANGIDSSYTNRKILAKKYGIISYRGTATQNLSLLKSMRRNANQKGSEDTISIVDYLKARKMDSSYLNRKRLAEKYGITSYSGTAAQNTALLKKLRK